MDNEGEALFQPHKDFQVLSGDSGQRHLTQEEWNERIPKKVEEEKKVSHHMMLQQELSDLENQLSDDEFEYYELHKEKLGSLSEKIYFLKLHTFKQREHYLWNKGKLSSLDLVPNNAKQAIRDRSIILGMSKEAVVQSWGKPLKIEVAGNPRKENERWSFMEYGKIKVVYFERGYVSGWDLY
jgi:hypothetical protein